MKKALKYFIFTVCSIALLGAHTTSASSEGGGVDNIGTTIIEHVKDDYQWHFFTIGDHHYTLYLPVIVYVEGQGWHVFSSKKFHHGHSYKGLKPGDENIIAEDGSTVWDLSITKNVASMLLSVVVMLLIFIPFGRAYKKRGADKAPKGVQSVFEPVVVFIRDEVAIPTLGQKYTTYMPYLLTVFFFIWINSLLGLIPGGANVTGDISVTMTLAVFTFAITNFGGKKHYWKHIFNTPGVPWWLKFGVPIMPIVEFIGIFTKPFALMIRLFANLLSGHLIILSLISLIFIFGSLHPIAGAGMSIVSVAFTLFMYLVKLLVVTLQAYIFTILSSLFIGEAVIADH